MIGMSRRALLILGAVALLLVVPAPVRAWQMDRSSLKRVPFSFDLQPAAPRSAADLNGDHVPERLALAAGRAALWEGNRLRWQSPPAWQVLDGQVTDLNWDGTPEITLLVWRPFKPWPVDTWLPYGGRIEEFHDANGMSCHLILIGWKQGVYRELWAGSAMADPVKSFAAADLRGDGHQYLITLEGKYTDPRSAPARRLKVWEWNGFGFTAVNELDDSFALIGIAQTSNSQEIILSP
jgi:hypothetical protein